MPDGPRSLRLGDIAQHVGGRVVGDTGTIIRGISNLELAGGDDLTFVSADRYVDAAKRSKAGAFVVARPIAELSRPQVVVSNPAHAFARIASAYFVPPPRPRGVVQPVAQGHGVTLGADVAIGPHVTLGDRVRVGARTTVYPGAYIGDDVVVGEDCVLYPNVVLMDRCRIGNRVVVHSGTVIGSDGFGYVPQDGRHQKIPQLGIVVIEDDVELGANVTVDRATFGETIVKAGTKVDNLVQIAHNVSIGEHSIIVAQVGIAGSTTLGRHVTVGGQAGIGDHLTVGDRAMIAARSGAMRDVPEGQVVSGNPAMPHDQSVRVHFLFMKLPEFRQEMRDLANRVAALEGQKEKKKGPTAKRKSKR